MKRVDTCNLIRNPGQCVERCRWYRPPDKSGNGWCSLDTDRALDDLASLCQVADQHIDRSVIDALKADLKVAGALRPSSDNGSTGDEELCAVLTRSVVAYAFLRQFGQTESQIRAHIRQAQSSWAHQYLPRAFGFHVKDIAEYVSDVDRLFVELQRKFSGKKDDRLAREALKLIQHPDRSQGSLWTYVLGGTFLLSLVALAAWVASSSSSAAAPVPIKETVTSTTPPPPVSPPPSEEKITAPPILSNGTGFWTQAAVVTGTTAGLYALVSRTRSVTNKLESVKKDINVGLTQVGSDISHCQLIEANKKIAQLRETITGLEEQIDRLTKDTGEKIALLGEKERELDEQKRLVTDAQAKVRELERTTVPIATATEEKNRKDGEISALRDKLIVLDEKFKRVSWEADQARIGFEEDLKISQTRQKKANQKIRELELQRNNLLAEIESNRQRESEWQDKLERQMVAFENLQKESQKSSRNAQRLINDAKEEIQKTQAELNTAKESNNILLTRVSQLEAEARVWTDEVVDLLRQGPSVDELMAEKAKLSEEMEAVKTNLVALEAERAELETRLEISESEKLALFAALQTAQNQHRLAAMKADELERKLDKEHAVVNELKAEMSRAKELLDSAPPTIVQTTVERLGVSAPRSYWALFKDAKNWFVSRVCSRSEQSAFRDAGSVDSDFYDVTKKELLDRIKALDEKLKKDWTQPGALLNPKYEMTAEEEEKMKELRGKINDRLADENQKVELNQLINTVFQKSGRVNTLINLHIKTQK